MCKCRIGTAKFFTLLLLLYHTSVNAEGYKLYAVDTTTGNVTLIPTTTDAKGITTAKVTSVGYMVLVKGELTATATPTPGTTTNPGTGANDVVGVAAALAVVALVSGAAISLKK